MVRDLVPTALLEGMVQHYVAMLNGELSNYLQEVIQDWWLQGTYI